MKYQLPIVLTATVFHFNNLPTYTDTFSADSKEEMLKIIKLPDLKA